MKRYSTLEISERQLEDLVRQAPELIELGLEFVDHQAFTDRGPLDVLLVDSGRSLVIAELKVTEDDSMLVQGMDYYDYVLRNLDGYARAYRQHKIDPNQEPRLFLIAPSFTVTLLNRIKWIDIPISLFSYQCIEFQDAKGDLVPVYQEIPAPGRVERLEVPSLEDRYNYITDDEVRSLAQKLVPEIQSWDPQRVSVEATRYVISIKYSLRVLAYVEPRRRKFLLSTTDSEGKWTSQSINSESDVKQFLPVVRRYFESIRAK